MSGATDAPGATEAYDKIVQQPIPVMITGNSRNSGPSPCSWTHPQLFGISE